jgi:hypothetical protein
MVKVSGVTLRNGNRPCLRCHVEPLAVEREVQTTKPKPDYRKPLTTIGHPKVGEMSEVQHRYDRRLAIWGDIDLGSTLETGIPDDVCDEVSVRSCSCGHLALSAGF